MTFYGESLQVDYVQVVGGDEITNDVQRRTGAATLASGDQWRAWLYPGDATYLDSDTEPVVVSWVLEVLSGTVTLDASMGFDPAYGNPAAAHPTSLGTHTVTGPATLVIGTAMDAADVLTASTSPMLVLDATSGSAVVQQVKVRVWPPGGAVGGWSEVKPGFSLGAGSTPAFYYGQVGEVVGGYGTSTVAAGPEAAWDAAVDDLAYTGVVDDLFTTSGSLVINTGASISRGGGLFTAGLGSTGAVVVVRAQDWSNTFPITATLTEGTDYIRAPQEVQGDLPRWAQQIGSTGTEWVDAYTRVTLGAETGLVLGSPTVHSTSSTGTVTLTFIGSGTYDVDGAPFALGPEVASYGASVATVDVALAATGRDIVVSFGHTIDPLAWPGWYPSLDGQSIGEDNNWEFAFPAIKSRPALPPYRVWDPAGAPPLQPLQWNQRVDGLGREGVTAWRSTEATSAGAQWRPRL